MSAGIIDRNTLAEETRAEVFEDAAEPARPGKAPHLAAVQVPENPAARIHTNMPAKNCGSAGIKYDLRTPGGDTTRDRLLQETESLNDDASVTGLILQMPLLPQMNAREAQVKISPAKDAEGMHPVNMGRLFLGGKAAAPCTPLAAVELLRSARDDLTGKETAGDVDFEARRDYSPPGRSRAGDGGHAPQECHRTRQGARIDACRLRGPSARVSSAFPTPLKVVSKRSVI